MDKAQARQLLIKELETHGAKPYLELLTMIEAEPITYDIYSADGKKYQVEVQAF